MLPVLSAESGALGSQYASLYSPRPPPSPLRQAVALPQGRVRGLGRENDAESCGEGTCIPLLRLAFAAFLMS